MAVRKGAVVIDTSLNTRKIDNDFKNLDKKTQSLINKYNRSVDSIKKQEVAIQSLKAKLDELTSGSKMPTSIKQMETELNKAEKETADLQAQYDKLAEDMKTANFNVSFWKNAGNDKQLALAQEEVKRLDNDSIGLSNSLGEAEEKTERLRTALSNAKADPTTSEEYKKLSAQLSNANSKLSQTKQEANQTRKEIKDCFGQKLKFNTDGISKGFNNISKKLDAFKSRMTKLITSVAIFSLLRNSLESLKNGFISLLKTNDTFSSSLNQIKVNLMTAFAPIYNAVLPAINSLMNAITKVTGTIATFVASLFGISTSNATKQAKKLSKALSDASKKGKEANNSLASFDKIDVMDNGSSSDNDKNNEIDYSGQVESSSKLLDFFNGIKDVLATIFEPFKNAWETQGKNVIDSIKNAFGGIKTLGSTVFGSILEVWSNGTGKTIVENALKNWTNIFNIVGELSKALSNAWKNVGNGTSIIQSIADIFIAIQDISDSISTSLLNWVMSENFQNVLNTVIGIVADLFKYASDIASWLSTMYDTYLAPVVDNILDCISEIIVAIGAVWNFLKPVVDMIIENIKNVLEPVIAGLAQNINGFINILKGIMQFITGIFTGDFNKAFQGIKNIVNGVFGQIKGIFTAAFGVLGSAAQNGWNAVKRVFSTVATFFKNTFTVAWNGVKKVFSTGGKIFDGIKDGIVKAFTSVVNTIIKGINKVVATPFNAINGVLNTIRNFELGFLGKPFKGFIKQNPIKVPQIPLLAQGAVIPPRQEFAAILGDQKHGTNIETPANLMADIFDERLENFMSRFAIANNQNDKPNQLILKFDGTISQFIRLLKPELDKESKRRGDTIIVGGID